MPGCQAAGEQAAMPDRLTLTGVERLRFNVGIDESSAAGASSREYEDPATGDEMRPTMAVFFLIQAGKRLWSRGLPRRRNSEERSTIVQGGDDRVVGSPGAAAAVGGVAERERSASVDRDLLQFSAGEEADPLAIGREERVHGSFRTGECDGCKLAEAARGEVALIARATGNIHDPGSIAREDKTAAARKNKLGPGGFAEA